MATVADQPIQQRALEVLRRSGNPFRNYFARNPDDEVCSRYHVPELYAREREQLLAVVDAYRYDPTAHSEVIPILGNKGSGKTHLLHSIKHGQGNGWQLLVTPGTFQQGGDFLEYILFQIIDTLLGGSRQRGSRPIEFVGEELTRRLLRNTLESLPPSARRELFGGPVLARWAGRFGIGTSQTDARLRWLREQVTSPAGPQARSACQEAGLDLEQVCRVVSDHIDRTEIHSTAGRLRRRIYQSFVRATLLGQEADLAEFLTHGFAEIDSHVRPTRQDLVLNLTKVLMEVFLSLKVPVVVAFDQLEDLLLVRRSEDGHKTSESFFAGIVQVMHQVNGICFLIFAERGLWNRFVPSLDGYIQDRLNNPIHVPPYGTIQSLRLEAPTAELVRQVVAARLRPSIEELPDFAELSPIFPFAEEHVQRIARTEPTLRDMLQQFRHLFDHLVYGRETDSSSSTSVVSETEVRTLPPPSEVPPQVKTVTVVETSPQPTGGLRVLHDLPDPRKWEVDPAASSSIPAGSSEATSSTTAPDQFAELWHQAVTEARTQLEPEGALTGATRELQAGFGALLQLCHDHGVKVGPWRLQHVVPDYTFGNHPTYGALTIAHWSNEANESARIGIGLFLGRGPGKPKDLQVKLTAFDAEPPVLDHLVLVRPMDDTLLTGKSKALWQQAEQDHKPIRLQPIGLDQFAVLYGFPRWLAAVTESLPEGQPLPNLAEFLQQRCQQLLESVASPQEMTQV